MEDNCKEHSGCITNIESLLLSDKDQWKAINHVRTKLNMILGAVIVSPFIVTILTLLIVAGGTTHP